MADHVVLVVQHMANKWHTDNNKGTYALIQ